MKTSFSITVFSENVVCIYCSRYFGLGLCPSWRYLEVSRPRPLQPPHLLLLTRLPFRFTPKQPVRGTLKWRQRQIWKEWVSSVKRCLFIVAIPQSRLASGLHGTLPQPLAGSLARPALSTRHRLSSNALKRWHEKRTKQEPPWHKY